MRRCSSLVRRGEALASNDDGGSRNSGRRGRTVLAMELQMAASMAAWPGLRRCHGVPEDEREVRESAMASGSLYEQTEGERCEGGGRRMEGRRKDGREALIFGTAALETAAVALVLVGGRSSGT